MSTNRLIDKATMSDMSDIATAATSSAAPLR